MAIYTSTFNGNPVDPAYPSYNLIELNSDITLQWATAFQDTDYAVSGIMNVNPSISGYTITLPNATLVSPGKAFIITNTSSNPLINFSLLKSDSSVLIPTISNDEGYFVYVQDNTSPDGEWGIIPFKGSDAITYVAAVSLTAGLTIDGSPIEDAGTFQFSIDLLTLWNNIANNSLNASKLLDGSIATAKLADNAVTTAKIADGAVTSNKIVNSAVTTNKINNLAVTSAKLSFNAVTTPAITDGAVTTAKLADDSVTTAKIAIGAVTNSEISASTIQQDRFINGLQYKQCTAYAIVRSDGVLLSQLLGITSITKIATGTYRAQLNLASGGALPNTVSLVQLTVYGLERIIFYTIGLGNSIDIYTKDVVSNTLVDAGFNLIIWSVPIP